ncbi:ABC transporter substrate-binding protein [Bacillus marinisedimentorum]|uniref:ABC transporter substrate-binding protein n=1 Tax=Bacillus marinisedimentorum TaxID=1821260 RepID=UPI0007DFE50E|nr:sugar ABC transporter substrate-binding protein [Bacillus marinisedimentorum]
MKKIKRFHLMVSLLLIVSLLVAGCSSGTEDTTSSGNGSEGDSGEISGEITVGGWEFIETSLKAPLEEFNKEYPNVKVNFKVAPPDETYKNLLLGLSSGQGAPDVVAIENKNLAQFVVTGELEDLTERIEPYKDRFNDFKLLDATHEDKIYAVPWDSGPTGIYYRRDVFEEAGLPSDEASVAKQLATWDKYLETAEIIKEKTGKNMLSLSKSNNYARIFEMMMQQQNTWYYDENGKVIVNNEKTKRILEYFQKLWDGGYTEETTPWTDGWYAGMAEGNVATAPNAVWLGGFLKSWIAPDAEGKWGVVPLPVWEEGGNRTSNDGGSTLVITKQSENKEAAWAFVEFMLTRDDSQLAIFKETDAFPSLESTYDEPYFAEEDPYFGGQTYRELFTELVGEVPYVNYTDDYDQAYDLAMVEISQLGMGKQTVDEALKNLEKKIKTKTGRD